MSKPTSAAKRKYNNKVYEYLQLVLPKGSKGAIKIAAGDADMSVNAYANRALLDKMGLNDWPAKGGADNAGIE